MDTAWKGAGLNDNIYAQVDAQHKSGRMALRPNEAGLSGSYTKCLRSGVIAAGLTGPLPVWQMRWGASDKILIPRKMKVGVRASTTAFGATPVDAALQLSKTKGHSALDTTNGTIGSYTSAKTGARSSRFPDSQFAGDATALRTAQGGIVILNTSASGLTGGTKVADSDPIAQAALAAVASAAALSELLPPTMLIEPVESTLLPMEIDQNEGLNLVISAIGATGTWMLYTEFSWDEYIKKDYFA